MKLSALIIDIDECKKRIGGYDPRRASEFHTQSARIANKLFDEAIKKEKYQTVCLMCGGSASGKTEFVSSELVGREGVIVYDSTLSTIEGVKVKVRNSRRKNKDVEIYALIPDDLERSFGAFLARKRVLPPEVFYKTHSGCRRTLLWVAKNRKNVPIHIFESAMSKSDKLQINKYEFDDITDKIGFLERIQVSEKNVVKLMTP